MVRFNLKFCFALFLCSTVAVSAFAQQYGIETKVDTVDVTVDTQFNIVVSVQGGEISQIVIPEGEGIVIGNNGNTIQHSIRTQMINGSFSQVSNQKMSFPARTTQKGTVVIPPFIAIISGKEYESDPITLHVTEGKAELNLNQNLSKRGNFDKPEPDTNTDGQGKKNKNPTLQDVVHISCDVDKEQVYQGELVIMRLRLGNLNLGTRNMLMGARSVPPMPPTEGFYRAQESGRDGVVWFDNEWEYNGVEYLVPLYPTRPGEYTLGPWVWEGVVQAVNAGRGIERAQVKKESKIAKVKVLPLPDRPEGFSGAVGSYDVELRLAAGALKQGVPADLNLIISGYGNPDAVGAPKIPELEWANLSNPEIKTERSKDDLAFSKRIFTFKLNPHALGEFIFPPIDFVFFDPDLKEFLTRSTAELQLKVEEGMESNQLIAVGGQTQPKNTDSARLFTTQLAPPIHESGQLVPVRSTGSALNTVSATAPVLAYMCFFAFVARKRRMENDPIFARRITARKRSRERLKGLLEEKDPPAVLYKTLATFVADRFAIPPEGLTSVDIKKLLRERGVDTQLSEAIVRILRMCERARFAGGDLMENEILALRDAAEEAMNSLESQIGWGGSGK